MLLITRPIAQTKNLESLLLANEIDFALFPTFEIKKLKRSEERRVGKRV